MCDENGVLNYPRLRKTVPRRQAKGLKDPWDGKLPNDLQGRLRNNNTHLVFLVVSSNSGSIKGAPNPQ